MIGGRKLCLFELTIEFGESSQLVMVAIVRREVQQVRFRHGTRLKGQAIAKHYGHLQQERSRLPLRAIIAVSKHSRLAFDDQILLLMALQKEIW